MEKLSHEFFERDDVNLIAKQLLGKIISTNFNGEITSVRIVETEAYVHMVDKASHAFNGRKTKKNEHMYGYAGTAYIYLCYGIHNMLNIVTNKEDVADAILIRAGEPISGEEIMMKRTGKLKLDFSITKGPGNIGKALGITKNQSGKFLNESEISIYEDGIQINEKDIGKSKRIGVNYAGNDALLEYRYFIKNNRFVSGRPVK